MAQALTMLSWGGISYKDGYVKAGMLDYLKAAIKWGTDYFIKCHVSPDVFYGQVGNGGLDHAYWGRPEDMTMDRPAYKIDANNPGSDLAAEVAASFASAALLFKDSDPDYSTELLTHAIDMYDLADNHHGKYSDSISDAAIYYKYVFFKFFLSLKKVKKIENFYIYFLILALGVDIMMNLFGELFGYTKLQEMLAI